MRRKFVVFVVVVILAGGLAAWQVGAREARRVNLSRDLVAAVIAQDRGRVQALLDAGADPNSANDYSDARMSALRGLRRVLSRAVHGRSRGPAGQFAAAIALERDNDEIYYLFLKHGFKVDGRDNAGRTILFEATATGRAKLVQDLLARGADPKAKDAKGRTPADVARTNGWEDVAEILDKAAGVKWTSPAGKAHE